MFLAIFLYPLRKVWAWLRGKGAPKHWLDFHVLLGLAAPFVIAFHSSFKFRGFAGIAFWIMVAVSRERRDRTLSVRADSAQPECSRNLA